MSKPHQSESKEIHLQVDTVNNVLDSVLEDIDGLLMDTIPPNPALTPLPPLPQSNACYHSNHQNNNNNCNEFNEYNNNNDDNYIITSPQYYLNQSINNNTMNTINQSNMYNMNNNNTCYNMNNNNNLLIGSHQQHFAQFFVNNNNIENKTLERLCPNNNNNNNNNNNSGYKSFITPSSSKNSLVSLGSNNSLVSLGSNITMNTNTSNTSNDSKQQNRNNNNNNILLISDRIKISLFNPIGNNNSLKLQLKDYVFISKDCTSRLSDYIVREDWGKDSTLLYKYIDYIFRCQAFKTQIIIINKKYLIFHSGLQRRNDKELLYGLLVPNKKYVTQAWRVQFGNIKNSFMSKSELLAKLPQSYLINDYLPKRTKFYNDLSQLLYDETYSIEVNWEERLTTNKDRIHRVLGNIAFFDSNTKFLKLTELIESFEKALKKTKQIAELNPRLAVAQGFIDTKNCSFRMELLLPLMIEFPLFSTNFYIFALAMNKSKENERKYIVKSILTMDMAYSNARLVGYVDSNWLKYGKNNYNNSKNRNKNDFFFL